MLGKQEKSLETQPRKKMRAWAERTKRTGAAPEHCCSEDMLPKGLSLG
jgi:hypothetical protein